jgi:hypothetical protein
MEGDPAIESASQGQLVAELGPEHVERSEARDAERFIALCHEAI